MRLILISLLLVGCATKPSGPPPVPYPMEGVTVYGSSWIATNAGGVSRDLRNRRWLTATLRALEVEFREERRRRALDAEIQEENDN